MTKAFLLGLLLNIIMAIMIARVQPDHIQIVFEISQCVAQFTGQLCPYVSIMKEPVPTAFICGICIILALTSAAVPKQQENLTETQ